ncbi:MAG: helical backbone metal receptor [Candidatus Eisenbacteria bacterium]
MDVRPTRLISLVPSLTEAILDLGGEDRLVGATEYCPASIDLPRVGGPRTLRLEALKSLRPDAVIACIEENTREQLESVANELPLLAFSCRTLEDALRLVRTLGDLLGAQGPAAETLQRFEAARREVRLRRRGEARAGEPPPRPRRVFYPVWRDPWLAVGRGCFPAAMLAEAGGVSVFADAAVPYPEISPRELPVREPERILLPDEPWRFGEADAQELAALWTGPGPRIVLTAGRWAAWYGTRMDEGLRALAAAIE